MCLFHAIAWSIPSNVHVIPVDELAVFQVQSFNIIFFFFFYIAPSHHAVISAPGLKRLVFAMLYLQTFNSRTRIALQGYFRLLLRTCTEEEKKNTSTSSVCALAPCSGLKWNTVSCWLLQALQSQHKAITNACSGLQIDFTATVCKYSATQFVQRLRIRYGTICGWKEGRGVCGATLSFAVTLIFMWTSHRIQGHGICHMSLWSHQLILFEGQGG